MKEVVVTKPLHYEIREVPIPEPEADQVQIKLMACGVCGSDIHIYKGENRECKLKELFRYCFVCLCSFR